jgi:DNA-binding transcriptional LysR family regulator
MNKAAEIDRMLVRMPSLRALKSFVAAAKYQNFTRAAESLCVTQAAISRQIRELEEILGVDLFTRSGRTIELTQAGHMLFDAAYLSFANIAQAAERIRTDRMSRRELRVCASPAFSSLWLASRLPDFFRKNSVTDINILTTDEFSAFEPSAKPDILISMNSAYKGNYKSIRLFDERIYPVCSPQFAADNPAVSSLEGLKKSVLLELSPFRMSQIYEHLDWNFWFYLAGSPSVAGSAELRKPCRANDYNVVLQMALGHQGIALGWDHLVRPLIDAGRLVRPVESEVWLKEKPHYLFFDARIADDEDFAAFKNWLLSYF